MPASRLRGLQVRNQSGQEQVCFDPPEGPLIINSDDSIQRIGNYRLPSTTNSVDNPLDGSHRGVLRIYFSIAVTLWEKILLGVLPGPGEPNYETIKAITFHAHSTAEFYGDDYAVK